MNKTDAAYAEVVLPLPLDKSFHYHVPSALRDTVMPGVRVSVPFGKRTMSGYVTALTATPDVSETKDIQAVIDDEPVVTPELLKLAKWLSKKYLCTLGEALGTIAPPSIRPLRRASRTKPSAAAAGEPAPRVTLSESQQNAVRAVCERIRKREFAPFLLHGVTSSGKTEVYLAMIEEALRLDRSAVFLLPEISLTPQFIRIVRGRFPGRVGIWHSKLSAGERFTTWDAARRGDIRIMLGARSAVFAPFRDLGLIVIDEEHEPTYKQEQKPSYHTREVALARGWVSKAAVVFGSATPSLESYHKARTGDFQLLEMKERIDSRALPPVNIVEPPLKYRLSKIISEELHNALSRILARREQAILFLNRRGFAPTVMCHDCGEVWQCPNCSVSLVYHKNTELHCHYCDHAEPWPGICPKCKSRDIAIFGVGTQKVEDELKRLFPQARVRRLDRDSTSKRGVYEQVYGDFKDENVDILIGTQMIAKGFDFPRVTLVGVIDADTALYIPDFRSAERTFQLLTQVAGRCGRSDLGGQVIVQSRHPQHYALGAAKKHDFREFFEKEIDFRKEMNYPPFCSLVNILVRGKKEENVAAAAQELGTAIEKIREKEKIPAVMLGPTPCARLKLHSQFRWQIMLKGTEKELHRLATLIRAVEVPRGVAVSIDIDPQNTV